ncbi:MAG: hypothetical protein H6822_25735 [Planctomycetaceae bacterium]|nr:hypothetical protein [Planctomycetaceae bacterium]MCB9925578.1 hypothetical protein [Planctomycetaceae bacterium]
MKDSIRQEFRETGDAETAELCGEDLRAVEEIAKLHPADSGPPLLTIPFGHGRVPDGPLEHPDHRFYRSGDHKQLMFRTFVDNDWPSHQSGAELEDWKRRWSHWYWAAARASRRTDLWDDRWYVQKISVGQSIVMIACNVDDVRYSAVTIRNRSDQWEVNYLPRGSSNGEYYQLHQGHEERAKIHGRHWGSHWQWDIWNPHNYPPYDGNDLIVSWGFD